LLYCVNTYRGDEKIKSFIWDLITPPEHAKELEAAKNNTGLAGPVSRSSRKGKKSRRDNVPDGTPLGIEWISNSKFDMEVHLDKNYRKHLDRHNNKILLRVRTLYYIQHEILVNAQEKMDNPNTALS
jgi:hypothetical protein